MNSLKTNHCLYAQNRFTLEANDTVWQVYSTGGPQAIAHDWTRKKQNKQNKIFKL